MPRSSKLSLMKHNPHCYWCGQLTRDVPPKVGGRVAPDAATVDHILPRRERRRERNGVRPPHRGPRLVLACYACNNERGSDSADVFRLKRQGLRDARLIAALHNERRIR